MSNSEPKAEGLNLSKIASGCREQAKGGQSEPIRKRGYYRALKRGETWAIMRKTTSDMVNNLCREFFTDYSDNWMKNYKFMGLKETLETRYIPITYGNIKKGENDAS